MRTRMFNLFSLIVNALSSITCIASIALMAAYANKALFLSMSFYLTIATFVISFSGMQYNVKTFNAKKSVTPSWYIVIRLMVISSLILNTIMSLAFTDGGAWDIAYLLTRLVLPILLGLCFILFDVDTKVPFGALFASVGLYFVFYSVFLPLYGLEILDPLYQIFDVKNNEWTVTLLLVVCSFACLIVIAALLRALNFSIHYAAYGKIEQAEFKKQIEQAKEAEREEFLKENAEADIIDAEPSTSEEIKLEEKPTEPIKDATSDTKTIKKVDTLTKTQEKLNSDTKSIKKLDTATTVIKPVESDTKTIKKVNTNTKTIKKVDTNTKSIKKVNTNTSKINKVNTETKTQPKLNTNTKTIKKVDTATKTVKKVDTSTKSINQIDTSTRVIGKISESNGRVYHVLRHDTLSKWQVKFEGASRALKLFKTQLEAINYAKELIRAKGGSIVIHSANGHIRKN